MSYFQDLDYEENDCSLDAKPNTHYCDSCNFRTTSTTELTKHQRSHFCTICDLFLTYPSQMKTHLVKVHNFSKTFVNSFKLFCCNFCSKKYSSKGSLHNHEKTVHSEAKFTCKECGVIFRHPRLLAIHRVRHGKKTIRCEKCHASFFINADYNKHINQVHRKIRPYECHKCGHYFCQRSTLTHHLSQHTGQDKPADAVEGKERLNVDGAAFDNPLWEEPRTPLVRTETSFRTRENDAPFVSLEYNLAQPNLLSDEEKDEVEINLNSESPAANDVLSLVSSMNASCHPSLGLASFSLPNEILSSSLPQSSVIIPGSLNKTMLRNADIGNRGQTKLINSVLLGPKDILLTGTFD